VKFNRSEAPSVWITAARQDGHVTIRVRDDGPGIPSEERPKLFRKFYQIDDDFTGQIPGWGLGLAFVKNVVAAHGGSVGLEDREKGSEFWIRLPSGGDGTAL
jgi:signal transduction histidine kinase